MSIHSVFITGSNRGIGLEMVRQYINSPNPPKVIFAACRDPEKAQELKGLKASSGKTALHLITMEVTNLEQIKAATEYVTQVVGADGLTLLINNAGIMGITPFPGTTSEEYVNHFQVNCIAPIIIAENLLPLLKKAAKKNGGSLSSKKAAIVNVTGQIAGFHAVDLNIGREIEAYRVSKNALNSASAIMARNLKESGILVVALHPGWVETDMGGKGAQFTVSESITQVLKTIDTMGEGHAGKMINFDGEILPW